jgi:hypothetical protein
MFLDPSLRNKTYTFLDRRNLIRRSKISQLNEIAQILGTNIDNVKNLILGINPDNFAGGRKRSFKKRSNNRKRYNSFKK